MAAEKTLKRLETLIWVLIYGGLFGVVIGLALWRTDPTPGLWLALAGAGVALAGAVLIVVRSRLCADLPSRDQTV